MLDIPDYVLDNMLAHSKPCSFKL